MYRPCGNGDGYRSGARHDCHRLVVLAGDEILSDAARASRRGF